MILKEKADHDDVQNSPPFKNIIDLRKKLCLFVHKNLRIAQQGHSMEPVTTYLSTWKPPCRPMSFAPIAASSKIDRGTITCQKLSHFVCFSG